MSSFLSNLFRDQENTSQNAVNGPNQKTKQFNAEPVVALPIKRLALQDSNRNINNLNSDAQKSSLTSDTKKKMSVNTPKMRDYSANIEYMDHTKQDVDQYEDVLARFPPTDDLLPLVQNSKSSRVVSNMNLNLDDNKENIPIDKLDKHGCYNSPPRPSRKVPLRYYLDDISLIF